MRMFGVAVVVMVLVAIGAAVVLNAVQEPVAVAFSTQGARPDLTE